MKRDMTPSVARAVVLLSRGAFLLWDDVGHGQLMQLPSTPDREVCLYMTCRALYSRGLIQKDPEPYTTHSRCRHPHHAWALTDRGRAMVDQAGFGFGGDATNTPPMSVTMAQAIITLRDSAAYLAWDGKSDGCFRHVDGGMPVTCYASCCVALKTRGWITMAADRPISRSRYGMIEHPYTLSRDGHVVLPEAEFICEAEAA